MGLNWRHQIQCMTGNLRNKLEALGAFYAFPYQTLNIICTAIIPSLAYAFAVTSCTPADFIIWDDMIGRAYKHEKTPKFWPWSTSRPCWKLNISDAWPRPSHSQKNPSTRHRNVTLNLLTKQIAHLTGLPNSFLTIREDTNLHVKRQLNYFVASPPATWHSPQEAAPLRSRKKGSERRKYHSFWSMKESWNCALNGTCRKMRGNASLGRGHTPFFHLFFTFFSPFFHFFFHSTQKKVKKSRSHTKNFPTPKNFPLFNSNPQSALFIFFHFGRKWGVVSGGPQRGSQSC